MKAECCPQFDPTPWNETKFTWEGKRFVRDRVSSFLNIPLNFGSVMKRNIKAFVSAKGKNMKKMYFFYTTCPKCAKIYGQNYVAILAQI